MATSSINEGVFQFFKNVLWCLHEQDRFFKLCDGMNSLFTNTIEVRVAIDRQRFYSNRFGSSIINGTVLFIGYNIVNTIRWGRTMGSVPLGFNPLTLPIFFLPYPRPIFILFVFGYHRPNFRSPTSDPDAIQCDVFNTWYTFYICSFALFMGNICTHTVAYPSFVIAP